MKTILLSLLITLCALPVCAQVAIGVIGGYSHSAIDLNARELRPEQPGIPAATISKKYVPKWHAGLIADIHLVKGLYLQPAILLSTKGGKQTTESPTHPSVEGTYKVSLVYLEFPVNLVYKISMGKGKLAVGAGAYCARALSGKYDDKIIEKDQTGTVAGMNAKAGKVTIENEMPETAIAYYYKKQDAGLNFMAGYEFKNGLLFHVNYSLGLKDVYTSSAWDRKNSYFGISAGYLLKLKCR